LLFLDGWVASCGVLLAVAGASKLYRGVRGVAGGTAVLRALRLPRRLWRAAETAVGGAECAVGLAMCAGVRPAALIMAGLGAAFGVLLGYARVRRVPGGCGCIQWRAPARPAAQTISWAELARSAMVLGAGVVGAVAGLGDAAALGRAWFGAGVLAGGAACVLLSVPAPWRTPFCHRPLWRPQRAALRALTDHGAFESMADSAGPFGPPVRHQRAGCTDEFWFAQADGPGAGPVVRFEVRHARPDGALEVRASLLSPAASGEAASGALG
jgi:hypothetical protein